MLGYKTNPTNMDLSLCFMLAICKFSAQFSTELKSPSNANIVPYTPSLLSLKFNSIDKDEKGFLNITGLPG